MNGAGLSLTHYYRLQLWLGGPVLVAYADLDPVGKGEMKNVATGDAIPLVEGRTLPIKFRLETNVATILGSDGGTVTGLGGNVVISFPAGATTSDIAVIITPAPLEPADPTVVKGSTVSLEPSPVAFAMTATLTLKYNPANIPGGTANEPNLVLVKADQFGWNEVAGSTLDATAHTVSAPLNGFSKYGVGVKKTRHALFRNLHSLYLGDVGGIAPVEIARASGLQWYAWSPDFKRIAYGHQNPAAPTDLLVHVMNADGSSSVTLALPPGEYYNPIWTGDGQRLVMRCGAPFANHGICSVSALDGSDYIQLIPPPSGRGAAFPLGFTAGGKLVYQIYGSPDQGLWTANPDGTNRTQILSQPSDFYMFEPTLAPNGSMVAFSGGDLSAGSLLCTIKTDGSAPYRCIPGAEANSMTPVAWSPDGTRIAFEHYVTSVGSFVWVATVATEQVSADLVQGFHLAWSANGSWISFSTSENGITVLYAMHPDGTGVTPISLHPIGGFDARWRP